MNVAVVGVGLIGGSIGLAARERLGARVVGYDPDGRVGAVALERGAVAAMAASVPEAVGEAELVFVAAPVSALGPALDEVLAAAGADCAVSDVGSTKRAVVSGREDPRFIGGHPLAGAETSGVEHARADLFDGATWYLTPGPATSGVLYERLHRALAGIGAQPAAIEAAVHDRVMASVSHLPHVFANVLVGAGRAGARRRGRRAGHRPELPRRDAGRRRERDDLARHLPLKQRRAGRADRRDAGAPRRRTRRARALRPRRDRALERRGARRIATRCWAPAWWEAAVHELRAAVTDRPGVVAEIALALGRAGINIVDIALSPSRDGSQGVVALWVRGEEQTERALELIEALKIPVARA